MQILTHPTAMKKPAHVEVRPDADAWLTLYPGVLDGATDASVQHAKQAQRSEREQAIQADLADAATDLFRQQAIDSLTAHRVAETLDPSAPFQERLQAGCVATRLHDAQWQIVSAYYASDAALLTLRRELTKQGHEMTLTDSQLREIAVAVAHSTHHARLRVWDGSQIVTERTWCRARLGMLDLREER